MLLSPDGVNTMVFVMETEYVCYEGRMLILNIILKYFKLNSVIVVLVLSA
jgi:hypothetical protein